jgi:hypothetical protein
MTICSNCKAEVTRSRLIWDKDGNQREECVSCAPQSFDKVTDPSDKKIWMGYEAHPNEYVHSEDGGFDRKPEYRHEQEQRLMAETEEEKALRERAIAKKRAERRTEPMDSVEYHAALRKAEEIAHWMTAAAAEGRDVN